MELVKDREIFSNPYIIQMDKFADSLKHLSETFLYLEDYKGAFTKDEIEEMFLRVSERVCANCEKGTGAWGKIEFTPVRWCMRFSVR